jgi:hypothetical protein
MHVAMNTGAEFGYIGREIEKKKQRERGGEKDSRKETEDRDRRPKGGETGGGWVIEGEI